MNIEAAEMADCMWYVKEGQGPRTVPAFWSGHVRG